MKQSGWIMPRGKRDYQRPLTCGLILSAALAGCGRSDAPAIGTVYEVKGKVLLADSKPLTKGRILFVRTQEPILTFSSELSPDGSFSLSSGTSTEGAPAGDYKVKLAAEGPPPAAKGASRGAGKGLPFPEKYLDEDASGLTATVKPEPNQLPPFVLK